jgi:uncharacterized protein YcaQ
MAVRRQSEPEKPASRRPPATTPEARENQVVAMAFDLAERRIREGSASAQEIVHFLRLGSSRERLEQERLAGENRLLNAKVEQMGDAKKNEALYAEALNAMRAYSGQPAVVRDDDAED